MEIKVTTPFQQFNDGQIECAATNKDGVVANNYGSMANICSAVTMIRERVVERGKGSGGPDVFLCQTIVKVLSASHHDVDVAVAERRERGPIAAKARIFPMVLLLALDEIDNNFLTMMTLKRPATAALLFLIASLLILAQDVTSFAPPTSPAISSRTHHRTNRHPKVVANSITTTTALHLTIPSWTYYSLAHVIGGTTGTPIVISGTKKGSWFDRIPKPKINPPNFVFGPVWTVLYSLMGVSIGLYNFVITGTYFSGDTTTVSCD
eukprot:scaffold547_cov143-Skeletonema_menzelii.AAC.21